MQIEQQQQQQQQHKSTLRGPFHSGALLYDGQWVRNEKFVVF